MGNWGIYASFKKIEELFYLEYEQYLLMVPILLAFGIGFYFSGNIEFSLTKGVVLSLVLSIFAALAGRYSQLLKYCILGVLILVLGYMVALYRVQSLSTPVLDRELRPTNITGYVENVHLYEDGKIRLTLERTEIRGTEPLNLVNVRVNKFDETPYVGDKVKLRAGLMPPPGPSMPGDYDYARQIWFQGIGAVGYAVSPLEILEKNESFSRGLDQLRQRMAERIRTALPGEAGTLAAALTTGIRGGMPESLAEAMRNAGLAHLLAISGLHMGLLCGVVFFSARFLMSLSSTLALNYPIKKYAAVIAGIAGLCYLFISGASIPTVRAFIMVMIVFLGVLTDRKAISLRLVAIAATIILVMTPEALVGVSFQMSFAAVVALVVVFERFGNDFLNKFRGDSRFHQKIIYFVIGSLFTSLVAEVAIAPFALYHFNKVVLFGLLANLIAMPVMGSWVMPWIVVTLILMPFGLEKLALVPMSWGLEVIMAVAYWVSNLPGATLDIPAIDLRALVLLAIGSLWLGIWRLKWRFLGIPMILASLYFAVSYARPDILIDNTGTTIAIRDGEGRLALSRMNGSRIVKDRWRQRFAAEELTRWEYQSYTPDDTSDEELSCDQLSCLYRPQRMDDMVIAFVQHEQALREDCLNADIVISLVPVEIDCAANIVLDRWDFYHNGGYAVWLSDNGEVRYQNVKAARGQFPWVK